ncbi:MAG: VWA domain-containing protein [Saprospirales bacterium]|nr:VWA domain-containing protein [Saprospirales bacterium]
MKTRNVLLIAISYCLIQSISYAQALRRPALDMVFVVDATSSMREELAALPHNLQYFSGQLADADLRTGGLVFRDQTERFIYRDYPLGPVVDSTWHFLTTFRAVGGGDDAEPLNDMLLQTQKFDWREGAERLVVFLSDAPPREPERTDEIIEKLKENGIRVVVLSPDASNEIALAWQQQVAESTGGLLLDWEDPYWHEAVVRFYCPEMDNATRLPVDNPGGFPN